MLDWQKHTKLRIFIRTICIVLIVTFLSYDLTWAGAGEVFSAKNRHASQDSPSVDIPQELGVIKESYTSKYNPHKLVIHIQDAHANVEAQENEAKLIKFLKDKYNVNLVSVEGGFGDFDAEFFRNFPKDKKIRDKIAKYFLSKAFISGSDYLLITENNPPAVYGAENKELYTAHLNTFKDNQATSDSLNRSLSTLEGVISTLKDKYYSKDLKELDAKISDFRQGRVSLEEYLSYLNIAAILNNVDLSKFPNLYSLITSQELEHKINFEKAETERQDLIDSLTKSLSKQDLEELVKNSLDFKANKITPVEYYSYLEKLTKEAGIQVNIYNNLFTYIKYITLSQNLDNSKVFDEIDDFTQSLKDKLAVTSTQRDIDNFTYIIRIFKGLSEINLSPKEYERFKNTREDFSQRKLAQFFRRYIDSSYLKSLPSDAEIDSLEKFYSLAHDRDKAIVSNSLNRLNREYSTNAVIIVAGGFHTQGLTSILKEKDISYVVVAPSIKQSQEKENTYFALLKDKKLPLQDILNDPDTLQIINSISDPEARQLLVNYWVARASRYYSFKELQAQLDRLRLSDTDQQAVELALKEISPETKLAKEEIIPTSHVEGKAFQEETSGTRQEKLLPAPASVSRDKKSFLRRFVMTFVLSFVLFIFTGCASTFATRLGPLTINSRTVVTLTQPKQYEPPISVGGSIELGEKVETVQPEKKQKVSEGVELNSEGKARLGPVTGELTPKVGITQVPQGEAPISLSGKVSLGETAKPEGIELATEAKARLGPFNAGINPKVGLSDVPAGEKPLDLKGKISLDEVKKDVPQEVKEPVKPAEPTLEISRPEIPTPVITTQQPQAEPVAQITQQLEERVKALEEANQQKEKSLEEAQAKFLSEQRQAQERLTQLEEENQRIQKTLSQTQQELTNAQDEAGKAKADIERLTQGYEKVKVTVEQQEVKRQGLEQELSGFKDVLKAQSDRADKLQDRVTSLEEYNKNWWHGLGTGWKIIFALLGALGIGSVILRFGLYKPLRRLQQLRAEIQQKEAEQAKLEQTISAGKSELQNINNQIEQAKAVLLETEKKRVNRDEEIKKAQEELTRLNAEIEKAQNELTRITEEKNRIVADLEKRIAELKTQIAEKELQLTAQTQLAAQQKEVVISQAQPERVKITESEIDQAIEFLKGLSSKEAQQIIKSKKINLRERIRFLHDEFGFDIVNGQARSLLSRRPETLLEHKVFLDSLGLPMTVSNLASSKRGFAKKELKQIIKLSEWNALSNEEKLSVASHLYDIYGLRVSWVLKDNDWYQLLKAFDLYGEPINYTARSIEFIQNYELARFQKFGNRDQTQKRLYKIKEVITLLELKVADLLTVVTKDGFELYAVKPESPQAEAKQPIVLEETKLVEEEAAEIEPDVQVGEERITALRNEIRQKENELKALEAEKQKKVGELNQEIEALTQRKDKLNQEIVELQRNTETRRLELSTAISDEEQRLSSLKKDISLFQQEKTQYEADIESLKKKVDEYRKELVAWEEKTEKAKQQEGAFSEEISAAQARIDEAGRKISESEEVLNGLREQISGLEKDKQTLSVDIAAKQDQKQKLEAELTRLNQKSQDLSQSVVSFNAQNQSLTQKEVELKASIEEKTAQLKDTEARINSLQVKGQEQDVQIPALEERKKQLEIELAKLSRDISDLYREVAQSQQKIEQLQVSLSGLEKDKERVSAELRELETKRNQLRQEVDALDTKKTGLDAQVASLTKVLTDTQKELSEAQGTLKGLLTEIEKLEAQKTTLTTAEIPSLEQQRNALRQEIDELGREKTRLEQELERIRKPAVTVPPVEVPVTKVDAISKARQEYTDIALQFQGVQNVANKSTFASLCERLKTFTDSLDPDIRSEVSKERDRANQELRNASNRLIQAAKRIRDEIKTEIEALSQLDNSANFEAGLSQLQAQYPAEIFAEFAEIIKKIKEDIAQKEKALEEQKTKAADLLGSFTARYQNIIEEIPQATSKDDLKEIKDKLTSLNTEAKANKQFQDILKPLQKEAWDSIAKREDELKVISKSLYRRISFSTSWQIFKHYFLIPWWIGRQLNNALSPQGLAQTVNEIYSKYTTVFDWFKRQDFYQVFKQRSEQLGLSKEFDKAGVVTEFSVEGDARPYHLELSDRSPEYLIRGYFSGDCTNPAVPFAHSSFQSATLNHLVMPGFLNFKVMRGRNWVGNIYAVVIEDNGKPVLLIDAVQVPWRVWGGIFLQPNGAYAPFWLPFKLFPIWTFRKATRISDASLKALEKYAQNSGFDQIWHSQFVSNFYDFKDYYGSVARERKYQESPSINSNMIIGWPEIQRDLHLSALYIESLNRKAWRIWTKEETPVKQTPTVVSQPPKVAQTTVTLPETPEQVIKGIAEGRYITQDTQELLEETFGVTSAYLSEVLSQRLRESRKFRKVLEILGSGQTIAQWIKQNKRESGYDAFESQLRQLGTDPTFDNPVPVEFGVNNDKNGYFLIPSERNTDDIVRGYISGDCTNPSWQFAAHTFNKYLPEHMLSPGFLNLKVMRKELHGPAKWIGNIYVAVLRQDDSAVLLIDAIQIPWKGIEERFGIQILPLPPPYSGRNPKIPFVVESRRKAEEISEAIIAFLSSDYARKYGFKKTYLGFGSNFTPLVEDFYSTYPVEFTNTLAPGEIVKNGGGEFGPSVKLPSQLPALSESEYLAGLKKLDLQTVGINKEYLDSFNNRRGFAEIKTLRSQYGQSTTTLFAFDPLFGYIALAGWIIYLGYRGVKWLINRHRQNVPYRGEREEVTSIVPVEDARIATVVSEGVLERRTVGVLLPLTEEERTSIQLRLGSVVDRVTQGSIETWPQTFVKAFKGGKTKILWEMPLPVSVSRIRKEPSSRKQAVMILRLLKIWMDAADSRVIRDLRRGIEEARESVTDEALANLDNLSDEQLVELLTTGYQRRFSKEIDKNIERFISHVRRFQGPSPEERGLNVSREIQSRYERLPRYLKWIFTQNPGLDNDPEIQELIKICYEQMMRLPTFSAEIESFAKDALSESIRLNPELGLRLFEYMTKDLPTQDEILLRLKSGEVEPTYSYPIVPQLEAPRGPKAPIAALPDTKQKEEDLKRQENLANSLKQALEEFKAKLNQRRSDLQAKEKDLKELTDAYEDARRAGENYTADVLIYAKEGAEAEVKHVREEISTLEGRVKAYEAQVQNLGKSQGGKGTTLYGISGLPLAVLPIYNQIREFLTGYGFPNHDYLIIPLLILSPWLIMTTLRVIIRNIFPAKSEPVKIRHLLLSKPWAWSIFAFPLLALIYTPVVARPWSLMGRQGLYSYWEHRKPGYYRMLKEEMKGLSPDFRAPGEKFRVAYDRKNINLNPSLMQDPIRDELASAKEFLKQLYETHPDFYKKLKNVIYGKRTEPEYRELFEVITQRDIKDVMTEVITRVQNWNMPNDKRVEIMQTALELSLGDRTKRLRRKIFNTKELPKKARFNAEYWQIVLDYLKASGLVPQNSKVSADLVGILKKRISLFQDQTERPRRGLLQFYLSGVTYTDFFNGFISDDCTKDLTFFGFLSTKLDPAFMMFKIVENGRWVGNLYTIVLKGDDGKEALLLDAFQLNMEHPLLNASDGQFKDTMASFLERFKLYLSQQGFKELLLTGWISNRGKISSTLPKLIEQQGRPFSGNFKKPGGARYRLNMLTLSEGHLQTLGTVYENVSFSGYKIDLPETSQEAGRRIKEHELQQLQQKLNQLLKEAETTEAQLQEKQTIQQQFSASLEREKQNNREASVTVISGELEKVNSAVADLERKHNEIRARISPDERKLDELRNSLGLSGGSKKVGKEKKAVMASMLALGFLLSTSREAFASGLGDINDHVWTQGGILLTFGTAVGLFFYILYKNFKEWFRVTRSGTPDIADLIEGIYKNKVNNQLRTGRAVLDPKSQEQVDAIQKIADEFGYLFHPETENPDELAYSIIEKINTAPLDKNMKEELLAALSLNLTWAKERVRFIKRLHFSQKDTLIDQRRLVEKLSEYLGMPSKTGKEEMLRDYIASQLKKIGGSEYKIGEKQPYNKTPNNLVWDIPASENYKGEALRIALHAHLDTGTHTPTLLELRGNSLIAEGKGKYAEAGLDDACALAAIMEALETMKDKQIPHPDLRIIFTAEEETMATGARYMVRNHPEVFEDIDLLVSIDGPLLDRKSPLAAKFINFGKAKERTLDPSYKAVIDAARRVSGNENAPEEFDFSAGDEQAFKEIEGLRIAHFRANYAQGHTDKDQAQLGHLVSLSEWVTEIAASLNKKPAVRPSKKKIAREQMVNSIALISQDKAKDGISRVIANSGKLTPGMDFFIYEDFPRKRLLQFKYPALGRLTLVEYLSGHGPEYYEVSIDDESIFDAAGNIFIMELLKSRTATVARKNSRDVYLSSILGDYAIPREFNPEVGGLVVRDSDNLGKAKVIEFPYKGFVQVNAVAKGLGRYSPVKKLVPFVHLNVKIELDRFGRFKGLTLPNLYDLIKSRYSQDDVVLGFHTHPDDVFSPPMFSYLDMEEVRKQTKPVILPLELVVGKRKSCFFHHYEDGETKQIEETELYLDRVIGDTVSSQEKASLVNFNQWLNSLSLLVSGEKRFTAKGKGMFTLRGRDQLDQAILEARQQGRGYLIWGQSQEWQDNREEYTPEIKSIIGYLQGYSYVNIPGLGTVDIPKTLSSANIIFIQSRDGSPGLVVNHENSYQVAFCDILDNTVKIDASVYSSLSYNYPEKAALLAHEAIELGAMRMAKEKNIPWTLKLANEVIAIAEDYEIQISGRNSNGRGSRLDERIEEILGFDTPMREMRISTLPETESPKTAVMVEDRDRSEILDNLRRLLEGLAQDPSANLPARLEQFPPPIAHEIRKAYLFRKVKGLPIDIDFLAALSMFFARLFPNHVNEMLKYHSKLFIYVIDNKRSTFGATLRGNTLYIQRSCIEDLIGRRISVKEVYQAIEDKDRDVAVALFRIIIHEIGGGFFKLSHEANQDLEKIFLSMLSKTRPQLSPKTEQEIRSVNATPKLDTLPRTDWAEVETFIHDAKAEKTGVDNFDKLSSAFAEQAISDLETALFDSEQNVRNSAAKALAQLGSIKSLTFLKSLKEKEPENTVINEAVVSLEEKTKAEQTQEIKNKLPDPFIDTLFTLDRQNNLVPNSAVIQAINSLSIDNGLTLEVDVDTLIDTSKGLPQLKGLGFREALASLYQAQEKKQIPENLRVRLISINPSLDKNKIIKVLDLTDDLLKSFVSIPEIPQDYVVKSLEPYLIAGSIRIIFEDNVKYWGKKVDVLVKRGEETKTLSSLGLIVAGLAKEPKFYDQLPKELKEYIVAKTDENGKVELDDEGKIKQLVFKPIEKTKVDTQYLDKLDKANKELEGMV